MESSLDSVQVCVSPVSKMRVTGVRWCDNRCADMTLETLVTGSMVVKRHGFDGRCGPRDIIVFSS